MSEEKMQEFIKIIRAIAFSVAVVAFCMLYRDTKKAEKQKREDAVFVKDFSEYVLHVAAIEAGADTSKISGLKNVYMAYDSTVLANLQKNMRADSAKYANTLIKDSGVALKWRGQEFEKIMNNIKSGEPSNDSVNQVANYYEQYKQHIQILSIINQVLNYNK
ncbi:MAG: hypothetical protein IJR92_02060 [Alphaproteobacteria bacterium]|nr:hypothetical protein [Alphaproteobacteria bacterium]